MEKFDIQTKCEDCVFAKVRESKENSCTIGRLNKFSKVAKQKNGYFKVVDRYCSALRERDWLKGKPENNLDVIVRAEMLIKTDVLILLDKDAVFDMDAVKLTLDSIEAQVLSPGEVAIVLNNTGVKPSSFIPHLKKYTKFNWRIDQLKFDTTTAKAIDNSVGRSKSQYYTIVYPGYIMPTDFLADIDEAINERLEQVSIILPEANGNCLTVSMLTHKRLYGHQPMLTSEIDHETKDNLVLYTLLDKANYLASKDNTAHLIKRFDEICSQN